MQKNLMILIMVVLIFGCRKDIEDPILNEFNKIVKFENGHFIDDGDKSFFPWGFNYTNPEKVGLIDDNWTNQTIWQIISSDFDEMKNLKANLIRIHLQYNRFMINATTPNETALNTLLQLVELAEEKQIYIDITGLGSYRKNDSPDWYDDMNDEQRWNSQKIFWKNIAKKVGHSKAVFAFNLMNEPVVSVGCSIVNECDWLPGNGFGGFHFVQNISRDPERPFGPTTKLWISDITDAIRSEDKNTMITTGFLGLGDITQFEDDLNYVSLHIYPESGKINEAVTFVQNNQTIPLVIEETSNLNCNIEELEQFLDEVNGLYHGLLGHYHGKKMEDLNTNVISEALQLNFLEMFVRRNPN